MKKTVDMMMRKDLLKKKEHNKLMKQTEPSKKIPLRRERQSLLKAIFLMLKREDVV